MLYQNSIRRYEDDSFVNNIDHIVLLLLKLILKLHQKKNSHIDEGWLFIGSFKVGSVPEMKNKEILAQFLYKPAESTEKLFI